MTLVQLQPTIPPLRQSVEECMSCPRFYVEVYINGKRPPAGMDSVRGTEIHRTMAAYLSHCAVEQKGVDLAAFDLLSRGAGPLAARILSGLRDSIVVDYQHLFATEINLSLDEDLQPTQLAKVMQGAATDSGKPVVHEGTLDGLYLFPEYGKLRIDDFKSHAKPFNPDDKPQGKKYAALAFKHFPWATEVTFRLIFVRYRNVIREVTYTRDHLPMLMETLTASRARQELIHKMHAENWDIPVVAGAHCHYCPLLTNRACPIAEWNPALQMSMEERLNCALWYAAFASENGKAMRDYVNETGKPIVLKDFNGKAYKFAPVETESEVYPVFRFNADGMETVEATGQPVLPIIELMADYAYSTPEDTAWLKNVTLSPTSLKKYLKTKKRVMLDQAVADTCDKVTKVALRISKPLDAVPEEDEQEEWEDEDEL